MINPLASTEKTHFTPPLPKEPLTSAAPPSKDDIKNAEDQVASLYYQSSIASLAQPGSNAPAIQQNGKQQAGKSLFAKTKDWLWGILGLGKAQPIAETQIDPVQKIENENPPNPYAGGVPRLQAPDSDDKSRLSKSITALSQLVNRMKEMSEFEGEMNKAPSGERDKLIFLSLIELSNRQKELKEGTSLIIHEHLKAIHDANQTLQKTHFDLKDVIDSENKTRKVLKWVNAGLTVIASGGSAISFAIGGPIGFLSAGVPLSFIGKGITSIVDGTFKYKNDKKTGELVIVQEKKKENQSALREEMSEMRGLNDEIAALLKTIRHHLENQARAQRASFGKNS